MDLLIAGDLHITDKTPVCRTDNYLETMLRKINFISDIADKNEVDVIFPGDLFDKSSNFKKLEINPNSSRVSCPEGFGTQKHCYWYYELSDVYENSDKRGNEYRIDWKVFKN